MGWTHITTLGRAILLGFAGYYHDCFIGRYCGFYMTTLGFTRVSPLDLPGFLFPGKGSKDRQKLEEILRKYGKLEEVSQLDTTALGKIIQEKEWEPEVIDALKKYVELEKGRRLYLSKMKNDGKE